MSETGKQQQKVYKKKYLEQERMNSVNTIVAQSQTSPWRTGAKHPWGTVGRLSSEKHFWD